MAVIGSLSVKLGLVTVEWDQATAKAKRDAKELQKAFDDLGGNVKALYGHWKTLGGAMSLSAVGLGALIQQTLQFSDTISDLAKGFDLTIGKTLQFRDAISQSGGNAEGASKILSTLFTKIEDARSGNEAAIAQFEKLGLTFADLKRMSPDEALGRIFDGLSKIGNTYERVKAVKEMLGKAGIGVDVAEVAQRLNVSTAEYQKHAQAIEKLGKVHDNLAKSFDNLKIAFADMIAPFSKDGVVSIEKFKAAMVAITAATVVSGLMKLVELSAKLVEVWKSGAKVSAAIQALSGPKGWAALGAGTLAYFAAMKAFELDAANEADLKPRGNGASGQVTLPGINDKPASGGSGSANEAERRTLVALQAKLALLREQKRLAEEDGALKIRALDMDKYSVQIQEAELTRQREIAAAKQAQAQALNRENISADERKLINAEYSSQVALANEKAKQAKAVAIAQRDKEISQIQQQIKLAGQMEEFDTRRLQLDQERVFMTERDYKVASERLALERKVAELRGQIDEAKLRMGSGPVFDEEKRRIEAQIDQERRLSDVRMQGLQLEEYRRTSFTEGWKEAFLKFSQDAEAYGRLGADMFNSAIGNMNSFIDNFVQTGKLGFKDLAASIIRDTMAMILKFQAMQLVLMGLRSLGFGSALPGGSVSVGDLYSLGGSSGLGLKLPGKASGGDVYGGSAYMVGENGPELFVPERSGSIVPNGSVSQALSSQPTVVYNGPYIASMSAIDTQSATQFLAKNKQAVWAANYSAQRSLPVSR